MSSKSPEFEIADSISRVSPSEWNALDRGDFIFADHRFLLALEESGSLGRRTGWHPTYLLARQKGELVGAVPLFAKTNSYGEYIFDWSWANAAHMAGDQYYPKLVAAIPFTPASGPKFLIKKGLSIRSQLAGQASSLSKSSEASSLHYLFITPEEAAFLRDDGLAVRHSFQYHWKNENWSNFEEFLGALRSKRRSEIKRERLGASQHGLEFQTLTGNQLTLEHARLMSLFYRSTTAKMGGMAYLTPRFFELLVERMPEAIVFMLALDRGEPVAGALNLTGGKTLFGRYWGSTRDYKHLHFELCYYRAIDWALANGIQKFEAGAQGEHKFNRGFRPQLTLSAHLLMNPGLDRAVREFIEEEKLSIEEIFRDYQDHDPFQRIDSRTQKDTDLGL